jgi:hypothetical protein
MLDAWIDAAVCQQPMQKAPAHAGQIGAGADRAHETLGPRLSGAIRQAFKDRVFQVCQHHRDAEARLVLHVVVAVERAADRAPLAVLPILALDDLVGGAVAGELGQDVDLGLGVAVVGLHRGALLQWRHDAGTPGTND